MVEIYTSVCQGVVTSLELRRLSSENMYVFVVAVVFVVVVVFVFLQCTGFRFLFVMFFFFRLYRFTERGDHSVMEKCTFCLVFCLFFVLFCLLFVCLFCFPSECTGWLRAEMFQWWKHAQWMVETATARHSLGTSSHRTWRWSTDC